MSKIKLVQDIYAAFGRGDIPAILDKLADNVEWDYAYRASPNPVPWLQPQHGKQGVAEFFKSLQDNLEIKRFAINELAEGPSVVVAILDLEAMVKRGAMKPIIEQDEAHIWHFDEAGKVVRFRHCADTYQHVTAYNA
jgi:ketosteroid isomerase-like protein